LSAQLLENRLAQDYALVGTPAVHELVEKERARFAHARIHVYVPILVERAVRAVPVVDDAGTLLGMVTHRELLRFLIPDYLQKSKSGKFRALPANMMAGNGNVDPRGLPVKDVMSRAVLCLSEDQTLTDVANLMNNKDVDRFPVVREGIVVGFLTRADLIRRLVANP